MSASPLKSQQPSSATGRFFEDFILGESIHHATPRTLTDGDSSLYMGLYGPRFAVQSSEVFARKIGYPTRPLDDMLVFHVIFGKTVPDISLNAVANLGYADVRFLSPVYAGDTLRAVSEIIGLKETSSGKTGIVYVKTEGFNQHDVCVLTYIRWVMVNKKDPASAGPSSQVPALPREVLPAELGSACPALTEYDTVLAGSNRLFEDYAAGERIDHVDGITTEEAEHQLATRLYQNTARIHFDAHSAKAGRFGKRLIYGGHVISTARALSFNGLENAFHVAAINGGRHVNPLFAGDTIYAWSEILATSLLPDRSDVGALRIRTMATKDTPCTQYPSRTGEEYEPFVLLDLDWWALMPTRGLTRGIR